MSGTIRVVVDENLLRRLVMGQFRAVWEGTL